MKREDVTSMLGSVEPPRPDDIGHRQALKIPLLSYRRTSRAGAWLLILPAVVALTALLKYELGIFSPPLDAVRHLFAAVDRHPVFTYLIPLVAVGLPAVTVAANLLALCHVEHARERRELILTIKIRPVNLLLCVLSIAVLVYFLLPDRLSF